MRCMTSDSDRFGGIDRNVDVVARQHPANDVDAHFGASLTDDLADDLAHRTLQNLVAIFCHPHDVNLW